jgi:hypothetical protein
MAVDTAEVSFADLEKAATEHLKMLARMIRLELLRRKSSGK